MIVIFFVLLLCAALYHTKCKDKQTRLDEKVRRIRESSGEAPSELHIQAVTEQRDRDRIELEMKVQTAQDWIVRYVDEIKAGIKENAEKGCHFYVSRGLPRDSKVEDLIVEQLRARRDFRGFYISHDDDMLWSQLHITW